MIGLRGQCLGVVKHIEMGSRKDAIEGPHSLWASPKDLAIFCFIKA